MDHRGSHLVDHCRQRGGGAVQVGKGDKGSKQKTQHRSPRSSMLSVYALCTYTSIYSATIGMSAMPTTADVRWIRYHSWFWFHERSIRNTRVPPCSKTPVLCATSTTFSHRSSIYT